MHIRMGLQTTESVVDATSGEKKGEGGIRNCVGACRLYQNSSWGPTQCMVNAGAVIFLFAGRLSQI